MQEVLSQEKNAEHLDETGRKRYIHVTKADREFIARALGITERMVFKGIGFESDTDTARKVRKLALERGGVVMVVAPEVETLFNADKYMRQYLPNDTLLEFSLEDGGCDVYHEGKVVRRYEKVSVSDIHGIQDWASRLR